MGLYPLGMDVEPTSVVALRRAVELSGSQSSFARLIGVSQQAVSKMLADGRALDPRHVLRVEDATGVSRHDLRPDIYPRDVVPAEAPTPTDRYNGAQA